MQLLVDKTKMDFARNEQFSVRSLHADCHPRTFKPAGTYYSIFLVLCVLCMYETWKRKSEFELPKP